MVLNKETYSDELGSQLAAFHANQSIDKNKNHLIQITKDFWLKYQSKDEEYLNKLIQSQNCLNSKMSNKRVNVSSKWIQAYAVLANQRSGKSVFDTDIVNSYNQHYSDSPSGCTRVPLEKSFVSHHRDVKLIKNEVAFTNVMIDLENYYFIRDKI